MPVSLCYGSIYNPPSATDTWRCSMMMIYSKTRSYEKCIILQSMQRYILYVIHSGSLPQARIHSFHTRAYMNHILDHLRKLLSNQPYQRTKRTFTIIPQDNLFNILVILLALRSNGDQVFSRISGVSPRSEEILTIINCAFGKIAKVNMNIQYETLLSTSSKTK